MHSVGGGWLYLSYIYYSAIYVQCLTVPITNEMLRMLATTMRINNFQYQVMLATRYPLTPYRLHIHIVMSGCIVFGIFSVFFNRGVL